MTTLEICNLGALSTLYFWDWEFLKDGQKETTEEQGGRSAPLPQYKTILPVHIINSITILVFRVPAEA